MEKTRTPASPENQLRPPCSDAGDPQDSSAAAASPTTTLRAAGVPSSASGLSRRANIPSYMAGSLRHLFGSSTDAAALALGSERRVPTDGGAGALQAGDQRTVSRACEGNALFASISKEDRLALFASLYTFHYRPGESIILHGEPGRNFYIIASGKCIVTSASAAVSRTLGPGDTFGELALLTGGKRSASVRVAEGSAGATLWVLDRTVFRKVLSTAAYERRKLYTQLLRDCAPLSGLDDYQRSLLCDAFTPCSWHPGDVILQQGAAEGARFHIIVHGGVTVTVGGIPVKKLGAGAFFGEVALLAPSAIGNAAAAPSATVTAEAARTGTIALGRSAFRRLLSAEQREALSAHVASYIFQAKRPNGVLPAAAAAPKVPGRVSVRSLTSSIAKLVPAAKPRLALRLGLTPRDVVLLKELGNGMTGRVYLARANLASGGSALLVVKVMSKHELVAMNQVREPQPDTIYHRVINATSPKVQNVIKEKEVLAAWDCPHIVQSLGSMADSSRLYLFLEFMRGGDLFTLLVQEGCLPLAVARFFASEVLVALTFIHDRHHVYRDLKPENVLLEESGHLKLADMGFCKQLMIGERTYTTCGTHDYMAPEVLKSQGYDRSADYWAFGVFIYEMLAGSAPFHAPTDGERLDKMMNAHLSFPFDFNLQAKNIISRLCVADITARLGMLSGGIEDIQDHQFWSNLDWAAVANKSVAPPLSKFKQRTDAEWAARLELRLPQLQPWRPGSADQAHLFDGFASGTAAC